MAPAEVLKEHGEEIKRLRSEGLSWPGIGSKFGVNGESLGRLFRTHSGREGQPTAAMDLNKPVDHQLLEAFRKTAEETGYAASDLWDVVIKLQKKYYKPGKRTNCLDIDLGPRPVGLVGLFDPHDGSDKVDYAQQLQDSKVIRDTPNLYAVLGGDGLENFIAGRLMHANLESYPQQLQWDLFVDYVRIIKESLLCMVSGNHEWRSKLFTGNDILANLARDLKILYDPEEYILNLKVGGVTYKVIVRHRFKGYSQYHDTHAHMKYFRFQEPYDVLMMGHIHKAAYIGFQHKYGFSVAFNAGSYMLRADYGLGEGFYRSEEGSTYMPGVVLYPGKKKIDFEMTPSDVAFKLKALG